LSCAAPAAPGLCPLSLHAALPILLELTEKALPPARRLLPELLPLQKALGELHDVDLRIQLLRSHRLAALLREQKETRTQLLKVGSEEHTSELQSPDHLVCRLLLAK